MNVSDWAWADGNCPLICASYQGALFSFPCPFGKGVTELEVCEFCLGRCCFPVAFLVKKRDGHEVIVPSLSSFSDVEILVLISCCPGGSLDCLLGSRNPKQAMTSWSFLSAQNFVAFTQSRAPTFPIRQNVQAVGPSYNFVMILSASQNSSFELRQLCSNCTAWCLSNTLLKTGLFLEYALSEESVLHSRIPGLAPAFVTFT